MPRVFRVRDLKHRLVLTASDPDQLCYHREQGLSPLVDETDVIMDPDTLHSALRTQSKPKVVHGGTIESGLHIAAYTAN